MLVRNLNQISCCAHPPCVNTPTHVRAISAQYPCPPPQNLFLEAFFSLRCFLCFLCFLSFFTFLAFLGVRSSFSSAVLVPPACTAGLGDVKSRITTASFRATKPLPASRSLDVFRVFLLLRSPTCPLSDRGSLGEGRRVEFVLLSNRRLLSRSASGEEYLRTRAWGEPDRSRLGGLRRLL